MGCFYNSPTWNNFIAIAALQFAELASNWPDKPCWWIWQAWFYMSKWMTPLPHNTPWFPTEHREEILQAMKWPGESVTAWTTDFSKGTCVYASRQWNLKIIALKWIGHLECMGGRLTMHIHSSHSGLLLFFLVNKLLDVQNRCYLQWQGLCYCFVA